MPTTEQIIEKKLQNITEHITKQNFSKPIGVVLKLESLEDSVNFIICKKLYDKRIIGNIFVCNFNNFDDQDHSLDLCNNTGTHIIKLEISNQVNDILKNISSQYSQYEYMKLYEDMTRGIMYSIALRTSSVVLTAININDLITGCYSETSDKIGDWNFIGDLTYIELIEIFEYFSIEYPKLKLFEGLFSSLKFAIFEQNIHFYKNEYFNMFDENGKLKNLSNLTEIQKTFIAKNKYKHNFPAVAFPYKPQNKNNPIINDIIIDDCYKSPIILHNELTNLLNKLRIDENFSLDDWIDTICEKIMLDLIENSVEYLIVGVSGGVDSAAVLALCNEVVNRYKSELPNLKIISVAMPINSTNEIQNRAYEMSQKFGIECLNIDMTKQHQELCEKIYKALNLSVEEKQNQMFLDGCFKSSLRTNALYAVSRKHGNSLVMGTGNKSEDGYLAYFAKSGDGMVDRSYIGSLYKHQVIQLAKKLGVINSILIAQPSADLVPNQTDEGELQVSYEFVELFMRLSSLNKLDNIMFESEEANKQFSEMSEKVISVHLKNKHKFKLAKIL